MKDRKQRFWRILAVGPDNLSVLEEMARNGKSARAIADVIVNDFGMYGDEIKSGELKRPTLEQTVRRWKNRLLRQQVAVVGGQEIAVQEESAGVTSYQSESVIRIRKQVAAGEKLVDDLNEQIAKENPLMAGMLAKRLAEASKNLIGLYSRLTAAENLERQSRRGLGRSDLYFSDEVEQAAIQHRTNVMARRAASALVPELLECLVGASDDPPPPPMTEADKEEVRAIYNEYNGNPLEYFRRK